MDIGQELTGGFEVLLGRAKDHVAVSVCAQEAAHERPSVCHADAHALVKEVLQLAAGMEVRQISLFLPQILAEIANS